MNKEEIRKLRQENTAYYRTVTDIDVVKLEAIRKRLGIKTLPKSKQKYSVETFKKFKGTEEYERSIVTPRVTNTWK